MKQILAVVLLAIVAGLVSCEVASVNGVKGIPVTVRQTLGIPERGVVVADFKSVGIEGADITASLARVATETKSKVAEVAEKAIEAAQPDRSKSVTPPQDDQLAGQDPALRSNQAEAERQREPEVVANEPATSAAESIADPKPAAVPGVTHFYGENDSTAVAAWAGAATMNPDYEPADATDTAATAAENAASPAAPVEPEASVEAPAPNEVQTTPEAPAPSVQAQVEPEPAPVSLGGKGQTSFFGFADRPDADQPWAAAATANPEYVADNNASNPSPEPQAQEQPAAAATPAETQQPAEPAASSPAVEAVPEAPPQSLGGVGQTSNYGLASMPDENQPWAAPASMNPEYAQESAAPAPSATPETSKEPAPEVPPIPVTEPGTAEPSAAPEPNTANESPAANPPEPAAPADETVQPPSSVGAKVEPPAQQPPAASAAAEACQKELNDEAHNGRLTFALMRFDITPDKYGALDRIAKRAKNCDGVIIEVRGHTDNTGRPASNKTLSNLRAKAVINYLTKVGVAPSKLKAVGLGEDKPASDNATAEGRRQNRRIEFVVSGE